MYHEMRGHMHLRRMRLCYPLPLVCVFIYALCSTVVRDVVEQCLVKWRCIMYNMAFVTSQVNFDPEAQFEETYLNQSYLLFVSTVRCTVTRRAEGTEDYLSFQLFDEITVETVFSLSNQILVDFQLSWR